MVIAASGVVEWWRRNCIGAGRVGDDRVGVVVGRGGGVGGVVVGGGGIGVCVGEMLSRATYCVGGTSD